MSERGEADDPAGSEAGAASMTASDVSVRSAVDAEQAQHGIESESNQTVEEQEDEEHDDEEEMKEDEEEEEEKEEEEDEHEEEEEEEEEEDEEEMEKEVCFFIHVV